MKKIFKRSDKEKTTAIKTNANIIDDNPKDSKAKDSNFRNLEHNSLILGDFVLSDTSELQEDCNLLVEKSNKILSWKKNFLERRSFTNWIRDWKLRYKEEKVATLYEAIAPKLCRLEDELQIWRETIQTKKQRVTESTKSMLNNISFQIDTINSNTDMLDDILDEARLVSVSLTKETAVLASMQVFNAELSAQWQNRRNAGSVKSNKLQSVAMEAPMEIAALPATWQGYSGAAGQKIQLRPMTFLPQLSESRSSELLELATEINAEIQDKIYDTQQCEAAVERFQDELVRCLEIEKCNVGSLKTVRNEIKAIYAKTVAIASQPLPYKTLSSESYHPHLIPTAPRPSRSLSACSTTASSAGGAACKIACGSSSEGNSCAEDARRLIDEMKCLLDEEAFIKERSERLSSVHTKIDGCTAQLNDSLKRSGDGRYRSLSIRSPVYSSVWRTKCPACTSPDVRSNGAPYCCGSAWGLTFDASSHAASSGSCRESTADGVTREERSACCSKDGRLGSESGCLQSQSLFQRCLDSPSQFTLRSEAALVRRVDPEEWTSLAELIRSSALPKLPYNHFAHTHFADEEAKAVQTPLPDSGLAMCWDKTAVGDTDGLGRTGLVALLAKSWRYQTLLEALGVRDELRVALGVRLPVMVEERDGRWALLDDDLQAVMLAQFVVATSPAPCPGAVSGHVCSTLPAALPLQCFDFHDSLPKDTLLKLVSSWRCSGALLMAGLRGIGEHCVSEETETIIGALRRAVATHNVLAAEAMVDALALPLTQMASRPRKRTRSSLGSKRLWIGSDSGLGDQLWFSGLEKGVNSLVAAAIAAVQAKVRSAPSNAHENASPDILVPLGALKILMTGLSEVLPRVNSVCGELERWLQEAAILADRLEPAYVSVAQHKEQLAHASAVCDTDRKSTRKFSTSVLAFGSENPSSESKHTKLPSSMSTWASSTPDSAPHSTPAKTVTGDFHVSGLLSRARQGSMKRDSDSERKVSGGAQSPGLLPGVDTSHLYMPSTLHLKAPSLHDIGPDTCETTPGRSSPTRRAHHSSPAPPLRLFGKGALRARVRLLQALREIRSDRSSSLAAAAVASASTTPVKPLRQSRSIERLGSSSFSAKTSFESVEEDGQRLRAVLWMFLKGLVRSQTPALTVRQPSLCRRHSGSTVGGSESCSDADLLDRSISVLGQHAPSLSLEKRLRVATLCLVLDLDDRWSPVTLLRACALALEALDRVWSVCSSDSRGAPPDFALPVSLSPARPVVKKAVSETLEIGPSSNSDSGAFVRMVAGGLLDLPAIVRLARAIPLAAEKCEHLQLRYSAKRHGPMMETLLERCTGNGGSAGQPWSSAPYSSWLLLVQEDSGNVFGAYIDEPLREHENRAGTDKSMLFRLIPNDSYHQGTGRNSNYAYLNEGCLCIGGPSGKLESTDTAGSGCAIRFEKLLLTGHSYASDCFGNDRLSFNRHFRATEVQVWTFEATPTTGPEQIAI